MNLANYLYQGDQKERYDLNHFQLIIYVEFVFFYNNQIPFLKESQ